jgi:uncharacterized protein
LRSDLPQPALRTKGPRYTPVSKRGDKPDAVAFLLKNCPELIDAQIARLIGTTKDTIAKIRDRSHWNSANIKPHDPVILGLCKQSDLDAALKRARRRVEREIKAGLRPGALVAEFEAMEETGHNSFLDDSVEAPEDGVMEDNGGEVVFNLPTSEPQPEIDHDAMMKAFDDKKEAS